MEDRDCPSDAPFCSPLGECVSVKQDGGTPDVATDAPTDTTPVDLFTPNDAPRDASPDVATDASMSDVAAPDVPAPDVPALDVFAPDVPLVDTTPTPDLQPIDVPAPIDMPMAMDIPVAPDVPAPVDVAMPMDTPVDRPPVDTGVDVPRADVPTSDVAPGPGFYNWTGVRPSTMVAPVAVAWHPSGSYALILNSSNTVWRYDPVAQTVMQVAAAGSSVYWRFLSFTPDGARAILLGNTGSGTTRRAKLFEWNHATSTLTDRMQDFTNGTYESLRWNSDGTRGALLASGANAIYVWFIAPDGTRSAAPIATGIVMSTGCSDVTWARDGFGDPALTIVCGLNTARAFFATMIDSGSVNWASPVSSGLTGNMYRIVSRPQGDVAFTLGSTSKLYRVRGNAWEAGFSSPELRGTFSLAWSTDGRRMLAFGGFGNVYEYRYDLYSASEILAVSIPLGSAPWTQPSGASINDIAWRPGCDEGVAVGGTNTIVGGTSAFVAPFSVAGGRACTP